MSIPVSYMPVKQCLVCKEVKPENEFYRRRIKKRFYRSSYCIACENNIVKQWKRKQKEKQG